MGAQATRESGAARSASWADLDGSHPWRDAVPGAWVDYPARRRRDAELAYLNLPLAREMGLLPRRGDDRIDAATRRAVLDAFAIVIVNEYDVAHGVSVPRRDRLPRRYMATRYLQLQHPDRRGTTSGDGRSVWNGTVTHRGATWDVTSCGTGVTRLCPATAELGKYLRTGNDVASYGCGTASLEDGLAAALMSEALHSAGIRTERTLAILELPRGQAIVVRAGRNLLRPAHLFAPLKQNDLVRLEAAVEYWIDRQVANGDLPAEPRRARRFAAFADAVAETFGRLAATFEREYVFCWLDWDGDNILLNGGIIDYGSVRQFGLFHRGYRFDDGPRWSTTITEQRVKARRIVQAVAQIRETLIRGRRVPLSALARDPVLARFDRAFAETRDRLLLRAVGLPGVAADRVRRLEPAAVRRLDRAITWLERARSSKGWVAVPDGRTWNAIYSARDLLRELPARYLANGLRPLDAREVLSIALSSFATRRDRRATRYRRARARELQSAYLDLLARAARRIRRPRSDLLGEIAARAAVANRYARITGEASIYAAKRLLRNRRRLGLEGTGRVIHAFVAEQTADPAARPALTRTEADARDVRRVLDALLEITIECRHGR